MLEFFHKYQRFFLIFVTIVIVGSFSFFGAFSTFSEEKGRDDRVVAHATDGSPLTVSQVQLLSRFISSDREDVSSQQRSGGSFVPNLCNDGVVRYDLLRTGLAGLLATSYYDNLQPSLNQRLERIKRYRPYAHPASELLSVRAIWDRWTPEIGRELDALQKEDLSPSTFVHLLHLYDAQKSCPPEFLRRVLLYQQNQSSGIPSDPRLQYEDFSLFCFHTLADWFGRDFLDLSAEFILNAARLAEQKGYTVSLDEAKADLHRNFQGSMQKLAEGKNQPRFTMAEHLRSMGFDERSAAEAWRSVLLFRRYFHGVAGAVFVDRLPYRDFAAYAHETAVVQSYQWPSAMRFKTDQDLFEFESYIRLVAKEKDRHGLPVSYMPLDEIEKKCPGLIQTSYSAQVVSRSISEIALRATVKEVCDWETAEASWPVLMKKFPSLQKCATRQERVEALEKLSPQIRSKIDLVARKELVSLHPKWIEEACNRAAPSEATLFVSKDTCSLPGVERPAELKALLEKASEGDPESGQALARYRGDGETILSLSEIKVQSPRRLLTFEEAKRDGVLARYVDRLLQKEGGSREEAGKKLFADALREAGGKPYRRLEKATERAMMALILEPSDPHWVKQEGDPLQQQFRLEQTQREIQRTGQEEWMTRQVFMMMPGEWSPLHAPADGDIAFFYYEEKKSASDSILPQMAFGQEFIGADAQRFAAQALIDTAKRKGSIVIPIQEERE